jgi:hypothetical protein
MKNKKKFFLKESEMSKNENVFAKLDEKKLLCIRGALQGEYFKYSDHPYAESVCSYGKC